MCFTSWWRKQRTHRILVTRTSKDFYPSADRGEKHSHHSAIWDRDVRSTVLRTQAASLEAPSALDSFRGTGHWCLAAEYQPLRHLKATSFCVYGRGWLGLEKRIKMHLSELAAGVTRSVPAGWAGNLSIVTRPGCHLACSVETRLWNGENNNNPEFTWSTESLFRTLASLQF